MKKRVIYLVILGIMLFGIKTNVYASEEVYYTTPKGIELTEEEYTFLQQFYWDNYPDIMTEEQYKEFKNSDLLTRKLKVKSVSIPTGTSMKSPSHTTTAKSLKIAAACSTNCIVTINCEWLYDPSVRSWDVIGAYLSGVSLINHYQTYVTSTSGTTYFSNIKTASNGFGNSVKLPSSGSFIIINTTFATSTGGIIYGSYQHAMQSTTLAVSQDYNFSLSGYGSVFAFYGNAVGKYDGMAGVDLSV